MKRILTLVALSTVFALANSQARAQQDSVGRVASFEMAWKERKAADVAALAMAAAQVMTGRELRERSVATPVKASSTRRQQIAIPEAASLDIVYLPDYDELRVTDTELAAALSPEREISQEEAMKIAKTAVEDLARRNVLNASHYAWDKADVGYTWVGADARAAKASQRKRVEYRITLRRVINGIELANAGLRIAVHASGRVSALRLGGVTVASKSVGNVEEPTGAGRWLEAKARIGDLKARFERDPSAPKDAKRKVAWSRVMYVAPESKRRALVEPLYVVSYSLEVPTDDGATAISRRKTIGFSLVDANAPPVDLTPPTHTPAPDRGKKQDAK